MIVMMMMMINMDLCGTIASILYSVCDKIYPDIIIQYEDKGQVTKLWLSCYLVLLPIDSKTR